jgi:hypothetical protein
MAVSRKERRSLRTRHVDVKRQVARQRLARALFAVYPFPPSMEIREQLQRTLGNAYTLERELGGGGMSQVLEDI